MTILSIVCKKLLCTNAHLGRRVAAHHFKVYICGSRNGIAILDSDKTLICLRNALHFIGSPIRQKGRSFFLKTNHLFRYEIMEEMASCINDSQWKIGAFFTNSFANKKKFHSRKKKINFGLNQQPDCVVILNADRKSSVILEADRSQIPIASLVDSTIPWESHKRITYPIPANDPIQFVYLFRHSITKTVILERPRITAMNKPRAKGRHFTLSTGRSAGIRTCASASSSPTGGNRYKKIKTFIHFFFMKILLCQVPLGLFFFLFWVLLSILFFGESAMAAPPTGEIAMAHPPSSSSPFVESTGEIDALMDTTSASSGEPSVNQATPEFHPVQQEVEAQQASLLEIRVEIHKQYLANIIRRNPWMRNSRHLLSQDIWNNVQSMVTSLELESLSTAELEQFLQDIRGNPNQLHFIFQEYWPGGK
uniref:Ribosomal protein S2 n=1 Tax=Bambusa oldhamii TaxID=58923 RepID=B8Q6N3_BAMOL|nr:ribosomal protein S2 [Bambusa oldhamii]